MEKKTNTKRTLSVILSLLMVLSVITFPTLKAKAAGGTLDDFVERCYTVTLERGSDVEGFNYWKGKLLNGEAVGNELAYGFLFSAEYTGKQKSNEDYVKDLYMLFMGRTPDEDGFKDWVGKLNNGKSRLEVFAGFANSQEFYNLCESYGISAGRWVNGYDRDQINNVNLFVERLYKTCLGRRGDIGGQTNWVEKLLKKEISGTECARSFIQSQEYTNKGLYDENYVENLYLAMMGRSSDEDGKWNWVNALSEGMTRDEVFAGFANSQEFANLCAKYKIEKGSYTAKDVSNPNKPENTESTKWYRTSRIDYNNGDYAVIKYMDFNTEISRIRYDKNGNYLGYDYRDETMSNGDVYRCDKNYNDDGTLDSEYYWKTSYSSDKSKKTEYYYSDEWNTLIYYDVYNEVEYTYDDPDGAYTDYHPINGTFYDADGNKNGRVVYTYYPDNRMKKATQYNGDGKLYWTEEKEYYDKKGHEWQYVKKQVTTEYNYDGTVYSKSIYEYDENENLIKETYYYDGALSYYNVHEYDSKGNQTKQTSHGPDDQVNSSYFYTYDYYGNLIKETEYHGDHLYLVSYTEYTYDGNNQMLKAVSYNQYDIVTSYWGYDYTDKGAITRSYYYDGSELYESKYEYGDNGYMTKFTKSKDGSVYYWEKFTYEECPE